MPQEPGNKLCLASAPSRLELLSFIELLKKDERRSLKKIRGEKKKNNESDGRLEKLGQVRKRAGKVYLSVLHKAPWS